MLTLFGHTLSLTDVLLAVIALAVIEYVTILQLGAAGFFSEFTGRERIIALILIHAVVFGTVGVAVLTAAP